MKETRKEAEDRMDEELYGNHEEGEVEEEVANHEENEIIMCLSMSAKKQ